MHPTQPVEIFGNFSAPFGPWPSTGIHEKFYGDRPRGTPPSGGGVNERAVAKYSDFLPLECCISEMVQDRR